MIIILLIYDEQVPQNILPQQDSLYGYLIPRQTQRPPPPTPSPRNSRSQQGRTTIGKKNRYRVIAAYQSQKPYQKRHQTQRHPTEENSQSQRGQILRNIHRLFSCQRAAPKQTRTPCQGPPRLQSASGIPSALTTSDFKGPPQLQSHSWACKRTTGE